jgi:hypothetical protein
MSTYPWTRLTVRELIDALKGCPQDAPVFVPGEQGPYTSDLEVFVGEYAEGRYLEDGPYSDAWYEAGNEHRPWPVKGPAVLIGSRSDGAG